MDVSKAFDTTRHSLPTATLYVYDTTSPQLLE